MGERTDAVDKLDNPVWHSLRGALLRHGISQGDTVCFPQDVAPFVAVPREDCVPDLDALLSLDMSPRPAFLGVCPSQLPRGWRYSGRVRVLQMLPGPTLAENEDFGMELQPHRRDAMLALATMAFPDFFRARTPDLGIYLGVVQQQHLLAMAGERLAVDRYQEISGVCTHPEFLGRGYAGRLTRSLLRRHRHRGMQSFLHVTESNTPARTLYERMGFQTRRVVELGRVERDSSRFC
jgi:ribosomal protein S18 acetylase RimI-like enzyme